MKSKFAIERLCLGHFRECVEQHSAIAQVAGRFDEGLRKFVSPTFSARLRTKIEAFHFASLAINFSERYTPSPLA